ncbi:putative portal protein [Myxococcus phage Mx9]|nr:putative portal protein [Myxococcus phage Mx9]
MATETQPTDFADTPQGWAQRWQVELKASGEVLEPWHQQGKKILRRYRDERDAQHEGDTRWNLYTTNVQTQLATLYGQTPSASVRRRWADAQDDVARVAAEMLERLLNGDIERDSDTGEEAIAYAVEDRLIPGLGVVRVRYSAEFEPVPAIPAQVDPATGTVLAPEVPATQRKVSEEVATDYLHWQDVRWSPARVWHEVRWLAFRAQMQQAKFNARFDPDGALGLWAKVPKQGKSEDSRDKACTPWDCVEVWEIWDKDRRRVDWYVEGYHEVLDSKEDPLRLKGFWPCPRPLLANATTDKLLPRPDFVLAQDFYNEIDLIGTRITLLERAIRVAGLYDKSSGATVGRLISEAGQNELIPVDNWAAFAEKGGIRGVVDWLPLEQVVNAITTLQGRQQTLRDMLYEVTGMADIMRGASDPRETARAQGIKARFGSVRIQRLQDEIARFASAVQRLKAEIIANHFDVETILAQSNAQYTFDAQLAPQAAQLLKSRMSEYRIEVKPEAVSLTDFAALKAERMEVLAGLASFMQAAAPLGQQVQGSAPFLLQMMQWAVAGLRGSSGIEGVLDQAITAAQQAQEAAAQAGPQQQPPDPKVLAQQLKGQQELAKVQADLQADIVRTQVETQANEQKERQQAEWNTREAAQKALISQATRAMNPQSRNGGMP